MLVTRAGGAAAIASVQCDVPTEVAPLIADPWPDKQRPRSGYDAKWSLPYCLAALLVDGQISIETFVGDPRPDLLARAATMTWTPWTGSGFPARFPARLTVELSDGTKLSHSIDDVRGGPARPFDRAMVLAKFRDNARRRLTGDAVERVIDAIDELETTATLRELTTAMRQVPRTSPTDPACRAAPAPGRRRGRGRLS